VGIVRNLNGDGWEKGKEKEEREEWVGGASLKTDKRRSPEYKNRNTEICK